MTILITEKILCLALLLQAIEFFSIRHLWSENGIWRWSQIRMNFPTGIRFFLDFFQNDINFKIGLFLKFILIFVYLLFPSLEILIFFIFSHFMNFIRFHGPYNGGSDYMTLSVLIGILISKLNLPHAEVTGIGYIAFQSTASYFIAGLVKVKEIHWWDGIHLQGFIHSKSYATPPIVKKIFSNIEISKFFSITTLFFELSFPIIFLFPNLSLFFIGYGFLFHLGNAYIFGLDRFFWIWISTYPSIIFFSHWFNYFLI
tara:strand:+ start:5726 stop:6496 length:771 start_codon:yes stop_codon:yes gene_type:complete